MVTTSPLHVDNIGSIPIKVIHNNKYFVKKVYIIKHILYIN